MKKPATVSEPSGSLFRHLKREPEGSETGAFFFIKHGFLERVFIV